MQIVQSGGPPQVNMYIQTGLTLSVVRCMTLSAAILKINQGTWSRWISAVDSKNKVRRRPRSLTAIHASRTPVPQLLSTPLIQDANRGETWFGNCRADAKRLRA